MKFKAGDKVIVNPNIAIGASFVGCEISFLFHDVMNIPGILIIESVRKDYYTVKIKGTCYYYAEEWLLPVPIFKEGDTVTVVPCFPSELRFGIGPGMKEFLGKTVTIEKVRQDSYTPSRLKEDGCKYSILEDNDYFSWPSSAFIINLTPSKNENQLQEKRVAVSRGDKHSGSRICCRRCKAAITVGHLSYKEVSGD